jgi:cell division initiation protein
MEVTSKTLREVEFREKMRGYHPEDVDHFLEEVANGVDVLQDRLRQATERAQRAEAAANEAGNADDTLRRTLVLAQRTADMAVQEARDQGSRIVASAEQQAQAIVAEADDRARRTMEDSLAESKAELNRLEVVRAQAQQDVDTLQRWLDEHKGHLQAALADAMAAVERAGILWPAPQTRQIDTGAAPAPPPRRLPPEDTTASRLDSSAGPETAAWTPSDEERAELRQASEPRPPADPRPVADVRPAPADPRPPSPPQPTAAASPDPLFGDPGLEHDDQAMDDFFDDNGDLGDERRATGRFRRRR